MLQGEAEARLAGGTPTWTPARIFMLLAAVWHLLLGVAGFLYDRTFPVGSGAAADADSGHIFGIFLTNGWHSLAALLLGLVALAFTLKPRRARDAALIIGLFHVGLVLALTLWEPETFWIASNGADQIVHLSTAVGGILCGLATPQAPAQPALFTKHPA